MINAILIFLMLFLPALGHAQTNDYETHADSVVYSAYGNISAIDAQQAINQLEDKKLSSAGGLMTGNISMSGNKIINVGIPAAPNDVSIYTVHNNTIGARSYKGLPAPTNGQSLIWSAGGSTWIHSSIGGASDHSALSNLNWSAAGHTIDGNIDFSGYGAENMLLHSGATLPTSPTLGQVFIHKVGDRKFSMIYGGSDGWITLKSLGACSIYVDKDLGSNNINYGGSSGAGAFKSINTAISVLPDNIKGCINIYISSALYTENISLQGKVIADDCYIRLKGTMVEQVSETTNADIHSGNYIGDTTLSLISSAHIDQIVRISGGTGVGEVGLIRSNTSTKVQIYNNFLYQGSFIDTSIGSIAAGAGRNPDDTSDFVIEDWGTQIQGQVDLAGGQKRIILDSIHFIGETTRMLQVLSNSEIELYACKFTKSTGACYVNIDTNSILYAQADLMSGIGGLLGGFSTVLANGCKVENGTSNVLKYAYAQIFGCKFDNMASDGLTVQRLSWALFQGDDDRRSTFSNNGGWGINAQSNSFSENATLQTYSGNVSGTHQAITGAIEN